MRHEENLPFKVVRTNGHDEIVARTNNLLVGRAAFLRHHLVAPSSPSSDGDSVAAGAAIGCEGELTSPSIVVGAPCPPPELAKPAPALPPETTCRYASCIVLVKSTVRTSDEID